LGQTPALIVNCVDRIHDPLEIDRMPEDAADIPYRWMMQGSSRK
jgi:hypothetical protein